MVSTVTRAVCRSCDWQPAGDPVREAEKHRKATGHVVATKTVPRG